MSICMSAVNDCRRKFGQFVESAEQTVSPTIEKIKDLVTSPTGQLVAGCGIGCGLGYICDFLVEKVITYFKFAPLPNPFEALSLVEKVVYSPFVCLISPIIEELGFRGIIQTLLKEGFESLYQKMGLSSSVANIAARVSAIFFSSLAFGLIHFSNAFVFGCNPVLFLPQVVFATLMGFLLGLAKEFSGELFMPVGMHVGNNTLAWIECIRSC